MARQQKNYLLTLTAERDFRNAKAWSLSRWGKESTKLYFIDLHNCAKRIASQAALSATTIKLDSTPELHTHPIREHYLVYIITGAKQMIIIALIRQTRDVPALLKCSSYQVQRQLKEIRNKLRSST